MILNAIKHLAGLTDNLVLSPENIIDSVTPPEKGYPERQECEPG
jgi:hypothetical protein